MGKIIKFQKPKEKPIEDRFMETLSEEQMFMFLEVVEIMKQELELMYVNLLGVTAECEKLRKENRKLKQNKKGDK